jgi:hypothetical protein
VLDSIRGWRHGQDNSSPLCSSNLQVQDLLIWEKKGKGREGGGQGREEAAFDGDSTLKAT